MHRNEAHCTDIARTIFTLPRNARTKPCASRVSVVLDTRRRLACFGAWTARQNNLQHPETQSFMTNA
jgi:hypothetical protein